MENEQGKFDIGNEQVIMPVYACITAPTTAQLIEKLNKRAIDGYRPVWDTLEQSETGFRLFINNHDLMPDKTVIDETELEIINCLDGADGWVIMTGTSLADEKNRLLINTDYDIVNAERQAHNPPLPAVKTAPEKKAWVELKVREREVDLAEAKRWKKYVEAMARKHQLPGRCPPWEVKAVAEDEEAGNVEVVHIGEEEAQGES